MKDKKAFGSFIKEKRIEKKYSQKELADLLFVTESAVSKWERGVTYPDITLISDICRILEITEHELIEASNDVEYRNMKKDAVKFNKIKKSLFWTLNVLYLLAIIICFIVNLAVDHILSWFFIVLASVLCGYSFCPTFTWVYNKHKNLIFIGTTFISLFFLFLTCSVNANDYWFMIPTFGVLLGYFIIFYPILFKRQKNYLKEEYEKIAKWFLISYTLGIVILLTILLVSIHVYNSFNLGLGLIIVYGVAVIPIIFGLLMIFKLGKKMIKPLVLILSGLVVFLFALGLINSIYLATTKEIKVKNIEAVYNEIYIDLKFYDINIHLSEDNEDKIVYARNSKISIESNVTDGLLTIKQIDERKFYDRLFDFNHLSIDLYLNENSFDTLQISLSTGNLIFKDNFVFENVEITGSTGDIKFSSTVLNELKIKSSTGNVEVINSNIGDLNVETSTGDIKLNHIDCNKLDVKISTGDINLANVIVVGDLNLAGSTGDVKLERFDAENIYITLSTGNVTGTILTSKFFIAKSGTGNVDVPETTTGGKCKITVSTGNICIKYH